MGDTPEDNPMRPMAGRVAFIVREAMRNILGREHLGRHIAISIS